MIIYFLLLLLSSFITHATFETLHQHLDTNGKHILIFGDRHDKDDNPQSRLDGAIPRNQEDRKDLIQILEDRQKDIEAGKNIPKLTLAIEDMCALDGHETDSAKDTSLLFGLTACVKKFEGKSLRITNLNKPRAYIMAASEFLYSKQMPYVRPNNARINDVSIAHILDEIDEGIQYATTHKSEFKTMPEVVKLFDNKIEELKSARKNFLSYRLPIAPNDSIVRYAIEKNAQYYAKKTSFSKETIIDMLTNKGPESLEIFRTHKMTNMAASLSIARILGMQATALVDIPAFVDILHDENKKVALLTGSGHSDNINWLLKCANIQQLDNYKYDATFRENSEYNSAFLPLLYKSRDECEPIY